jgi:hypothetical protein
MTMAPLPSAVSTMRGKAYLRHKNTPLTLTDITCSMKKMSLSAQKHQYILYIFVWQSCNWHSVAGFW